MAKKHARKNKKAAETGRGEGRRATSTKPTIALPRPRPRPRELSDQEFAEFSREIREGTAAQFVSAPPPSLEAVHATATQNKIPIDLIEPDPQQPRKHFADEDIEQLSHTLQSTGLLEPIRVRPHPEHPGRYLLVYGERRWRAAKRAGWKTIDVLPFVSQFEDPQHLATAQLVENLQRAQLAPLEVATALKRIIEHRGYGSRSIIAREIGRDPAFVTRHLQLLELDPVLRELLATGRCSDVRLLLELDKFLREDSSRPALLQRFLEARPNFEVTRNTLSQLKHELTATSPRPVQARPRLEHTEATLVRRVGVPVTVVRGGKRELRLSCETPADLEKLENWLSTS